MLDLGTSGTTPAELLGAWRMWRRVADRRAGLTGTVTGTLTLLADGSDVRWRERGTLRWNGANLPVTRDLLLREDVDGWQVLFADGRPFHPWRPGAVVEHPCGADLYRGLVDARPGLLRVLWDVRGPAKDQRLFTRCRRSAE